MAAVAPERRRVKNERRLVRRRFLRPPPTPRARVGSAKQNAIRDPSWYEPLVARRRREMRADQDVPRIPRGRGVAIARGAIIKIALTTTLLVMVVLFRKPCGQATAKFIGSFAQKPDAAMPVELPPGSVSLQGLSGDELKAAIEKARAD